MKNQNVRLANGESVSDAALSPRERRQLGLTHKRPYTTQKQRDEKLAAKGLRQGLVSAFDLAVHYGVEQKTITESEYLQQIAHAPKQSVTRSNDGDFYWNV